MAPSMEWTTEFYADQHGGSPVETFLDGLDQKTRARFRWSMEQLRLRNVTAAAPLVRHLIFLHGFQKKTQRTPRREIEIAARRYFDVLHREGRRG